MKYVGIPSPTDDAKAKVTGKLQYSDDIVFQDMLYGKILFSPVAHAKITKLDTSKAEALEGVKAVVTYLDSPDVLFKRMVRGISDEFPADERVFDTVVRFVGDKVAAVAAETEEIAAKAIRLIEVEYEELPAVFDPEEALKPDAYKIHPNGNLIEELVKECGDVDKAMQEADHVFETCVTTPMVHHGAIELYGCTAHWSNDNKLTVWGPQQAIYATQIVLAKIFSLPFNKVHVINHTIGGTFGGKVGINFEHVAALLAKKTGKHVRIRLSRAESMVSTCTRTSMKLYVKMGVQNDGTIIANDLKAYLNAGPYCGVTLNIQGAACGKMFKLYRIANNRFRGLPAYTNTPVGGAMRGFGSPKIFAAMEIMINKIAKELNIDPVEIREKNLIHPYDKDLSSGDSLGSCRPLDCLIEGAKEFRWEDRIKEKLNNDDRYAYGYGVATGLHGNGVAPFVPDMTAMNLSLHEDGSAVLATSICDHGGGSYTVLTKIIGEILDIDPKLMAVVTTDTETTPYDLGASASRNTWVGGNCAIELATKMKNQLLECAQQMLEEDIDNIMMKDGSFISKNNAKKVTRAEIILYGFDKLRKKFIESVSYSSSSNAGSYGAHFASVRVDKETGEVKVLDYVAACDVGTALNPLLLEGQVEGGIQMGMGLALSEQLILNEKGKVINANLKKYRMPRAKDMPNIKVIFIEKNEDKGPYGAKSIGEAATVPVAPAIVNAINNALDTNLTELPVTSEKILKAIK
jgi:CO/xanthine dehydrogenase Mo-binding subunit